ncbi:MAG: hypothetical protein ABWZ62_02275, partial [Actinomycetota bacterium]
LAGVAFLVLHRWWYGGWTPYAAGDHFVGGELSVVGTEPDYLGRSRRLLGLLVDRGFGLAAWQPAWLLALPALAVMLARRPRGWAAVAVPLAAGWLVATFVALTMHGWWFAGRQVVVVLPLAALAVAWWIGPDHRRRVLLAVAGGVGVLAQLWLVATFVALTMHGWWFAGRQVVVVLPLAGLAVAWWTGRNRRRRLLLAVAGGFGMVAFGWLVAEGAAGRVTWAVDFAATADPLYRAWRLALPDYLAMSWWTWVLHGAWLVTLTAWAVVTARPRKVQSRLRSSGIAS